MKCERLLQLIKPLRSAAIPRTASTRRQAVLGAAYAALVGCATPSAREHGDLASAVAPPKDLDDLLRRIKDGLVNNVFLQPGFATEPNLLRFFGAREISWQDKAPSLSGSLRDFGSSIASMSGRQYDPLGLTIDFAFNTREEPLPNAFLRLVFGQTVRRVRYSELAKIFGRAWKPVVGRIPEPNPHRIFLPPTDPHGNEGVDLDLSDASFVRSVRIEFDQHGTVWLMTVDALRK